MTFEVQQTRWDRMIRRVSGSIGPGSRVSETLSELFPVFDVEQAPAELLVLGGTRMAIGSTNTGAVAAVFQLSQLHNPVDSGTIITLQSLHLFSVAATGVVMGILEGPGFTNDNPEKGFADGRLQGANTPVGQVRDETAAAPAPLFYRLNREQFLANIFQPPNAIAVLTPGTGWAISPNTVNQSLTVSYQWIERPAQESELSL